MFMTFVFSIYSEFTVKVYPNFIDVDNSATNNNTIKSLSQSAHPRKLKQDNDSQKTRVNNEESYTCRVHFG
eukprot:Awhi_evm1s10444